MYKCKLVVSCFGLEIKLNKYTIAMYKVDISKYST